MINEKYVRKYCREDLSKIENYELAIKDNTMVWHCHHRRETIYSRQDLIEIGEYWNRPAMELIFLTKEQHSRLHHFGKHHSDETKQKISEANKGKMMGGNNPFFGKHHSDETKKKLSDALINNPKKSLHVLQFSKDGRFIKEYPSINEAERQTKIDHSHVIHCCLGKRKSAGGYCWKYTS